MEVWHWIKCRQLSRPLDKLQELLERNKAKQRKKERKKERKKKKAAETKKKWIRTDRKITKRWDLNW